jgi:hypothetical protein
MSNKFFMYLPLYLITALCVVKNASAQTYTGPYGAGMGGAGRASVSPLEAAYMNPAQLAFISQNHFYGFFLDEELQNEDIKKIGVAGIDTTTSTLFPGSFTFTHGNIDTAAGKIKTRNYELSLGRREYEKVAFGITLKRQEWDGLGVEEADHDANIGITYAPVKELGLAFVTYNVIEDSKTRTPRKYALGSYYILDPFAKFALDLAYQEEDNADKGLDLMTGFTVPFGEVDMLFGYSKLSVINEEFFTTGFVWNGPRLSLAYAFREGSKGSKTHNIDFGFFF